MTFLKNVWKWFASAFKYLFQIKKKHGPISHFLNKEERELYEKTLEREDRK